MKSAPAEVVEWRTRQAANPEGPPGEAEGSFVRLGVGTCDGAHVSPVSGVRSLPLRVKFLRFPSGDFRRSWSVRERDPLPLLNPGTSLRDRVRWHPVDRPARPPGRLPVSAGGGGASPEQHPKPPEWLPAGQPLFPQRWGVPLRRLAVFRAHTGVERRPPQALKGPSAGGRKERGPGSRRRSRRCGEPRLSRRRRKASGPIPAARPGPEAASAGTSPMRLLCRMGPHTRR